MRGTVAPCPAHFPFTPFRLAVDRDSHDRGDDIRDEGKYLQSLQDEMDADRRRRMRANAKHLHDAGHLREGLPITHATDVLWTFSAPEFFELLVLRCGWGVARFGDFVGASIAAALLRPV